jgi:hypothetical protein
MKVRFGNTGKCFCVNMSNPELVALSPEQRMHVEYLSGSKTFKLTPSPNGKKFHSTNGEIAYLTGRAGVYPSWGIHDTIELEATFEYGSYFCRLPENFEFGNRTGKKRQYRKQIQAGRIIRSRVAPNLTGFVDTKPKTNVILQVGSKTWAYNLPDEQVIALAIDLAHKGYANQE